MFLRSVLVNLKIEFVFLLTENLGQLADRTGVEMNFEERTEDQGWV